MCHPDQGPVAPVVLQEPQRLAQDHGSAQPIVPAYDSRWNTVIGLGEVVIWQQQAAPVIPRLLSRLLTVGPVAVLLSGLRAAIAGGPRDDGTRHYLLTNRAAYIARGGFVDIVAYPITRTMRLGLGGRSVSFTTTFGPTGDPEPVGFLDIPDSEAVYAMIRDIQKALP